MNKICATFEMEMTECNIDALHEALTEQYVASLVLLAECSGYAPLERDWIAVNPADVPLGVRLDPRRHPVFVTVRVPAGATWVFSGRHA